MHDSDEVGAAQVEMPQYVSHKKVWALELATTPPSNLEGTLRRLDFVEKGYASINVAEEMFSRYEPMAGDFYVVYADGYKSFSPRKAFLEGYIRIGTRSEISSKLDAELVAELSSPPKPIMVPERH